MRIRLRGINTVRSKAGEVYYYHRGTGQRLVGVPGSAEFIASFEAAARSAAQSRNAGTVKGLIKQYCDSRQWKKLAASTREIGRLNLRAVEDKWGRPRSRSRATSAAVPCSCDGTTSSPRRIRVRPTRSSPRSRA